MNDGIWSRLRRMFARPSPPVHTCVADDCDRPTEPQDGPFCVHHNWSNWMSNPPEETTNDKDTQ